MRVAVLSPPGPYFNNIVRAQALRQVSTSFETVEIRKMFSSPSSDLYLDLMSMVFVDAGIRAQDDGYDAVFINAVPDYGLSSMRSALRIPVVGAGQASIQVARGLGKRFSIVTVWPSSTALLYERLLQASGSAGDCVSVRYVHDTEELSRPGAHSAIHDGMEFGRQDLLDRIERTCRQAVDDDGADTIVLGCTCMSPVGEELARRLPQPVLDPVKVGFGFTRLLLDSGLTQSDRAYVPATDDERKAVVASVDALTGDATADVECEVCLVDSPL